MFQEEDRKQEVKDTLKIEPKAVKPKKGRFFKKRQIVNSVQRAQ